MSMTLLEEMQKANAAIKTVNIKGKEYSPVQERITAFRKVYPAGFIRTDIVSIEDGVCVMRAHVGYNLPESDPVILGEGTAYEKETSSYINKTSYIENCETSAVGRALGMAGFGIDGSVASFEEVANAITQQETEKQPKKAKGYNSTPEPVKSRETAPASSEGHISEKEWKQLQLLCKEKSIDTMALIVSYGYEKGADITGTDYLKMLKEVCDE